LHRRQRFKHGFTGCAGANALAHPGIDDVSARIQELR
jgi:hypothetical protein